MWTHKAGGSGGQAKTNVVILALAGLTLMGAPARAADNDIVFTIAKYPVEAQAANAVLAKKQALADGQRAAFHSLLKRIVPVTAYSQVTRLERGHAAHGTVR